MVIHGDKKRAESTKATANHITVPSFATGRDIQNFFRLNKHAIPVDALKALRNQLTLEAGESAISAQDARLIQVKEWLEITPGAQDVFSVLEKGTQPALVAVCLSMLASLLALTSQHFVYQPLGQPVVKTLLTSNWLRKIESYLSGSHSELCLTSLKLLNAMSTFARAKEQKTLLEAFHWDVKVFHKLLYMRRKENNPSYDILAKPDIRTLCLQFILSFVSSSSPVKAMFLEHHRDIFLSIFKGVGADPYPVIQFVLELLWTKLWQDQKVKRTLKVGLFGEKIIQQLVNLYERSEQEGSDPDRVPADVVHHFLLAICTHRGIGICFADNGWYPRREDEGDIFQKKERVYNKILANVLKMLKVSDDARQQELALKILRACPELIAGSVQSMALTTDPRLSSKWLANMAFLGAVVSLPVPIESFYLPSSTAGSSSTPAQYAYQPVPPPLSTIINNIIPSASLKSHLSKALQSPHALVQHTAGLTLARCLRKYESVRDAFRTVEHALEEDEIDGQWSRRQNEIEREVRKRIPEINVVIAFSNGWRGSPPTVKSSMLAELSERLLWLYHLCMPSVVTEARYDIARSLQSLLDVNDIGMQFSAEIDGLNRLRQLHVLRMLTESDLFVWNAKSVPSAPSNLYILLDLYLRTKDPSIREALLALLTQALKDSLLFQHDPEELHLWLSSLPSSVRSAGGETPDGASLKDERDCVVSFLDSCMQRCAKTPNRYIDEMNAFITTSEDVARPLNVSPVLVTVLEQLNARMRSKSLEPSDALSLTTFVRKVVVGLLGKQHDVKTLRNFAKGLAMAVNSDDVFAEFPVVAAALRKECDILDKCFAWCISASQAKDGETESAPSQAVFDFVSQVEKLQDLRAEIVVSQAYELVDWMRLVDRAVSPAIVERISSVIKRLHAPALSSFCLHFAPGSGLLWSYSDDDLVQWVPVYWILLHSSKEMRATPRFSFILQAALKKGHRTLHDYRCLTGLLMHRLRVQGSQSDPICVLEALSHLLSKAKCTLTATEFSALKEFVLVERQDLKLLSFVEDLPHSVTSAIDQVIGVILNAASVSDRLLVSHICKYWATRVLNALEQDSWQHLSGSLIWIKFMSLDDRLVLVERMLQPLQSLNDIHDITAGDERLPLLEALLSSLINGEDNNLTKWMNQHLAGLLRLRKALPSSKVLEKIICRSVGASLPLGCNGLDVATEAKSLRNAVSTANTHWMSRLLALPENASVDALLQGTDWSADISHAVASFVYCSQGARRSFWSWLTSGDPAEKPIVRHLAPAVHAFFDSCSDTERSDIAENPLVRLLFCALVEDFCHKDIERSDARLYASCIAKMTSCMHQRNDFIQVLSKRISAMPADTLHVESLRLVHLMDISAEGMTTFIEAVLGHALQWAVRHLSENIDASHVSTSSLAIISEIVRLGKGVAPHFAEPVIAAAIRHHLCNSQCMFLTEALFANVAMKPMNVNRHLQSILQHPHFENLVTSDLACEERDAVTKLLFTLLFKHPTNTCQPSHVEPLIRLYRGSSSLADRRIFAIFQLFEEQRRTPIASIMARWSQSGSTSQQTSLDAVLSVDAARVFRTCLSFPDKRTLALPSQHEAIITRAEDGLIYDPVFLLLLFAQVLADCPPRSALSWVSLYRTNIVCVVVRCLSSVGEVVRRIAMMQLGTLYKLMQSADMQEREHVVHVLDLLRDQLQNPSDGTKEDVPRLPSYTTLFLAHALRGIFYPANFIYPLTARFLLQRPEIDVRDVPMLYGMLYSSGDDWKKERGWLVRFLSEGVLSSEDWRLLKRRHTWDLLASMFQGAYDDKSLRHSILEVLANLTCLPRATNSLILRSSLVQWIEIQIMALRRDESTAWAKIIENILVVADSKHIEQATRGEWQIALLRCLILLVKEADITLLRLISRTMSRLTSERVSFLVTIPHALESAIVRLKAFEDSNDVSLSTEIEYRAGTSQDNSLPPHRSFKLHQPISGSDLTSWGKTVESLWSVSLKHGVHGSIWDQLCSRILLWRALSDAKETPAGEWARKQTVLCLAYATNVV